MVHSPLRISSGSLPGVCRGCYGIHSVHARGRAIRPAPTPNSHPPVHTASPTHLHRVSRPSSALPCITHYHVLPCSLLLVPSVPSLLQVSLVSSVRHTVRTELWPFSANHSSPFDTSGARNSRVQTISPSAELPPGVIVCHACMIRDTKIEGGKSGGMCVIVVETLRCAATPLQAGATPLSRFASRLAARSLTPLPLAESRGRSCPVVCPVTPVPPRALRP